MDNLKDTGVGENYSMNNGRITFKLNDKTLGCFEKNKDETNNAVADDVKNIMMQNSKDRIEIEYFDNVKGDKTYHNLVGIRLVSLDEQPVQEEVISTQKPNSEITPGQATSKKWVDTSKGQAFGLACNLALRVMIHRGTGMETDDGWVAYRRLVQQFYEENAALKTIVLGE